MPTVLRASCLAFTAALAAGCADDTGPDGPPIERCTDVSQFRVGAVALPKSPTTTQAYGLDLDGDHTDGDLAVDNQLGATLTSALSVVELNASATFTAHTTGDTRWLVELRGCAAAGEPDAAYVTVHPAPETADALPITDEEPAFGRWSGDVLTATHGTSQLPVAWLVDLDGEVAASWQPTERAAFRITGRASATPTIDIAGGLDADTVAPILTDTWALGVNRLYQSDMTNLSVFDDNGDGTITGPEILAGTAGAFLEPDLAPPGSGLLSMGFQAALTPE